MARQLHKPILVCGLIAIVGICQFAFGVSAAIQQSRERYEMTNQFLSDLGRNDNPHAAAIFNPAVIMLGVALIPFFLVMPGVLARFRGTLRISGVTAACGLIGIGLTPYDDWYVAHLMFLTMWVAPMLLMMIVFLLSALGTGLLHNGRLGSRWLLLATGSAVLAIGGYALIDNHHGHVVFQKIVAVLAVAWFVLVFLSVVITTVGSLTRRTEIVERQAISYLRTLEHRR